MSTWDVGLEISERVLRKLRDKHNVSRDEIVQCFANRLGGSLKDTREKNRTDPPTLWFVAETDMGRLLKIVYIRADTGVFHIKTAYAANEVEIAIYKRVAAVCF